MTTRGQLAPERVLAYCLAGNATITLRSAKTGTHFTFKIQAGEARDGKPAPHFVKVLTGPDNTADYEFLGTIFGEGAKSVFKHGKKSRITPEAPSAKAFAWFWQHALTGTLPASLEVFHEGTCGRCARPLTDPTSIERGLGPVCRGDA